jgi:hypothetical protein
MEMKDSSQYVFPFLQDGSKQQSSRPHPRSTALVDFFVISEDALRFLLAEACSAPHAAVTKEVAERYACDVVIRLNTMLQQQLTKHGTYFSDVRKEKRRCLSSSPSSL